jgi:hypothetical protein
MTHLNRKQRRRAEARGLRQLTKESVHAFGETGRINKDYCALEISLVRGDSLLTQENMHLLGVTGQFITACVEAEPGHAPICLTCDSEFSSTDLPTDFLITSPMVEGARQRLLTGICCQCARLDHHQLLAAGFKQMKKIWPDAVTIPTNEGMH